MAELFKANWQERSLSYLCRSFDQLYQGEEYVEAKPVTHIGFLNFAPFPDFPEFNAHAPQFTTPYSSQRHFQCFLVAAQLTLLMNRRSLRHHDMKTFPCKHERFHIMMTVNCGETYSDKLTLIVVNLTQTDMATEEDRTYNIDYWAKLFKAKTWEEVQMIAEHNKFLESASQTMYELSGDELIERQCRARRDYYKQVNTYNRAMQELEAANQTIDEQSQTIEQLQKRIAELEAQRTANS